MTFWPDEDAYREQRDEWLAEDLDEWARLEEQRRLRNAADERQEGEPQ